jgi:signal transduction histidine kinase
LAFILLGAVFVYRATRRQFRLSEQQQNLMMAITHELKTPIAITRLNLETLQKRELDASTRNKLLNNSILETGRLNNLCNNILLAAQFDSGSYRANKLPVNLFSLIDQLANDARTRYPAHQIITAGDPAAVVLAEEWLLTILISNLVENALAHSPQHAPIRLEVHTDSRGVELVVDDKGPGIAAAEQKLIFKKFYRTGNELTRQKKGTGLGLYLCRKIADINQAEISLESEVGKGSRFKVLFPLFHA